MALSAKSGAKALCSNCQCKTVEFVIAFSGPAACRAADVCRFDEAGFPWKIYCDKYQTATNAAAPERLIAQNNVEQLGRELHAN